MDRNERPLGGQNDRNERPLGAATQNPTDRLLRAGSTAANGAEGAGEESKYGSLTMSGHVPTTREIESGEVVVQEVQAVKDTDSVLTEDLQPLEKEEEQFQVTHQLLSQCPRPFLFPRQRFRKRQKKNSPVFDVNKKNIANEMSPA